MENESKDIKLKLLGFKPNYNKLDIMNVIISETTFQGKENFTEDELFVQISCELTIYNIIINTSCAGMFNIFPCNMKSLKELRNKYKSYNDFVKNILYFEQQYQNYKKANQYHYSYGRITLRMFTDAINGILDNSNAKKDFKKYLEMNKYDYKETYRIFMSNIKSYHKFRDNGYMIFVSNDFKLKD